MNFLKFSYMKEDEPIEEQVVFNMVWCLEFSKMRYIQFFQDIKYNYLI